MRIGEEREFGDVGVVHTDQKKIRMEISKMIFWSFNNVWNEV